MARTQAFEILSAAVLNAVSERQQPVDVNRTIQALGRTTAGPGTAAIQIQGSLDGINFVKIATINLVLSDTDVTDGFATNAAWKYLRARVTGLTGTGATVDVWLGA